VGIWSRGLVDDKLSRSELKRKSTVQLVRMADVVVSRNLFDYRYGRSDLGSERAKGRAFPNDAVSGPQLAASNRPQFIESCQGGSSEFPRIRAGCRRRGTA